MQFFSEKKSTNLLLTIFGSHMAHISLAHYDIVKNVTKQYWWILFSKIILYIKQLQLLNAGKLGTMYNHEQ